MECLTHPRRCCRRLWHRLIFHSQSLLLAQMGKGWFQIKTFLATIITINPKRSWKKERRRKRTKKNIRKITKLLRMVALNHKPRKRGSEVVVSSHPRPHSAPTTSHSNEVRFIFYFHQFSSSFCNIYFYTAISFHHLHLLYLGICNTGISASGVLFFFCSYFF